MPSSARSGSGSTKLTQTKGDGETHPFLSPNDEFADFETWDKGNLDGSVAKTKDMLEFEYARSALKNGLELEQQLGTNPYKFGLIGSTDAHTGLVGDGGGQLLRQDHAAGAEPRAPDQRPSSTTARPASRSWTGRSSASGYAAVWATENTRESIFDAMQRKETYATTGPRMAVRFFGGWDFEEADAQQPHCRPMSATPRACRWAATSSSAPAGKAPTFLVAALKDPIGANLDRIQIVKGWLDAKDGKTQEKVYDVVWSRRPQAGRGRQAAAGRQHGRCRRTRPGPTRSARRN